MTTLSARKEVILLNLKWFVKRLPKVFETAVDHKKAAHPRSPCLTILSQYSSDERSRYLLHFGVHTVLVYEYQIALLRDFNAVKAVVNYVSAFILRCFDCGELKDFRPCHFNPTLFLTAGCKVAEGQRYVKTSPVGAHQSSLSWKISDIFTKPALRHQSIHFLNANDSVRSSLETQFLSPFTPFGRTVLPETYGFRNLMAYANEDEPCYRLFHEDACTLHRCKIRSMDINEDTSKMHFHMSYRSLFLIFFIDVVDPSWTHLETCASFRKFCQENECRPVVFHSQAFQPRGCLDNRYLFEFFDLFGTSVDSGYSGESSSSTPDLESLSSNSSVISRGIDNPAFVC